MTKLLHQVILRNIAVIATALAFITAPLSSFSQCTVSSSINASNFLATYGTCSGVMTIPSGTILTMDAGLTIPASVTELIIEPGGHIYFTAGNNALTLN